MILFNFFEEIKLNLISRNRDKFIRNLKLNCFTKFKKKKTGREGDIIAMCLKEKTNLKFNFKNYISSNGKTGKKNNYKGNNGKDIYIYMPIYTYIFSEKNKFLFYFKNYNERFVLLKGGLGETKKNLSNKGINNKIIIRKYLKFDFVILGLSNSGKSTFIQNITSYVNKIGNYFYTTTKITENLIKLNDINFNVLDTPGKKTNFKKFNFKFSIIFIDIRNISLNCFNSNKSIFILSKVDIINWKILKNLIYLLTIKLKLCIYYISNLTWEGINDILKIIYSNIRNV